MDISKFLLTSSIALGLSSAGTALAGEDAGDAPERPREHRAVAGALAPVVVTSEAQPIPPALPDDAP